MNAIILSNGNAERMGREKEFMSVVYRGGTTPLIMRTIEQFLERGIRENDIFVLSGKNRMKEMFGYSGIKVVDPGPPEFMLVDFKKAMEHWGDSCVISFGDVLWSERAMDEMLKQTRYRVIGSSTKHGGEGYGWTAFGRDKEWVTKHCDFAIRYVRESGMRAGGGGWQMLRHMLDINVETHLLDNYIFHDLGSEDYTMDFDYPRDYELYKTRLEPLLLAEGKVEVAE